jgi:hypothetical protein
VNENIFSIRIEEPTVPPDNLRENPLLDDAFNAPTPASPSSPSPASTPVDMRTNPLLDEALGVLSVPLTVTIPPPSPPSASKEPDQDLESRILAEAERRIGEVDMTGYTDDQWLALSRLLIAEVRAEMMSQSGTRNTPPSGGPLPAPAPPPSPIPTPPSSAGSTADLVYRRRQEVDLAASEESVNNRIMENLGLTIDELRAYLEGLSPERRAVYDQQIDAEMAQRHYQRIVEDGPVGGQYPPSPPSSEVVDPSVPQPAGPAGESSQPPSASKSGKKKLPLPPSARPQKGMAGRMADRAGARAMTRNFGAAAGEVSGALGAAAGPLGLGLAAFGAAKDGFVQGVQTMTQSAKMVAGNDGFGLIKQSGDVLVSAWHDMTVAFVNRGKQLANYDGNLAAARAEDQVRRLEADIREAKATGQQTAELTTVLSKLEVGFQDAMLPVKNLMTRMLINVGQPMTEKMGDLANMVSVGVAGFDVLNETVARFVADNLEFFQMGSTLFPAVLAWFNITLKDKDKKPGPDIDSLWRPFLAMGKQNSVQPPQMPIFGGI